MPNKKVRYHAIEASPFYKLRSRAKLASILFISLNKLEALANQSGLYVEFPKAKSSGGVRMIAAPRKDLKAVQKRVASLLQRIAPPDFLFAPVSKRSYVDNATRHLGSNAQRLLDIEDFFPSCTANKCAWFFLRVMKTSPDVASLMVKLVSRNGSLPQGSPCSPILAYLCYQDMWREIQTSVEQAACVLSVYADDLTVSSATYVPEQLAWNIKRSLHRHGHKYNVAKERRRYKRPVEITGVILTRDRVHLPNRQRVALHKLKRDISALPAGSGEKLKALQRKVRGREAQARQVLQGNSGAPNI